MNTADRIGMIIIIGVILFNAFVSAYLRQEMRHNIDQLEQRIEYLENDQA